jgi:MFS family permease
VSRIALCGCLPAALGAFDFGLLALAGPRVAPQVGVDGAAYPWLFSSASFAYGSAVMPAAVLVGRLAPPRALAIGLAAVAAGAVTLAAARGLVPALAARVIAGAGGALAATAALALVSAIADPAARRAGFAAVGSAVAAGFAAGALAAATAHWRLVLVGVAAFTIAVATVAAGLPGERASGQGTLRGVRPLSAAIVAAAVGVAAADAAVAAAAIAAAVVLAGAGMRAADWLPAARGPLVAVCVAGAATTAGGVGATIVLGSELATRDWSPAWMATFGLGVLPGAALARRLGRRRGERAGLATGLTLQASALSLVALALAIAFDLPTLLATVVMFAIGHVAANSGAAAAIARLARDRVAPLAALLIAAQYVGAGVGPLLIDPAGGASRAVATGALITAVGLPLLVGRFPPRARSADAT